MAPSVPTVPAPDPKTPPLEVIVLPNVGRVPTTPELTVLPVLGLSPSIKLSEKVKLSPATLTDDSVPVKPTELPAVNELRPPMFPDVVPSEVVRFSPETE